MRKYEGKSIFKQCKIYIYNFYIDIEDIYNMRLEAKNTNNACLVDFFKLLMNSLYGKVKKKFFLNFKSLVKN